MKDKTNLMPRILVCLYIIIALLFINTIVLIVSNGSSSSTTKKSAETTEENGEYDVSMFKEITSDDFADVVKSSEAQVIYIGRSSCGYCVKFLPTLQQAQDDYGYKTNYLDITTITSEDQQKELFKYDTDDKFLEENFGSTPMVLIAKDGKITGTWVGYKEYSDFASFLEEHGIEK